MARDVAHVVHLQDHLRRHLLLDAEVIGDDAGGRQRFGPGVQVRRELSRAAAGRVVDVAVEDVGDFDEWRILSLAADLGSPYTVIKNAKARAKRGLAVAEDVIGDAHARSPVVPVGGIAARRQPDEKALEGRIIRLRETALGSGRKVAAINGDAVVKIARARHDRAVLRVDPGRLGRIE